MSFTIGIFRLRGIRLSQGSVQELLKELLQFVVWLDGGLANADAVDICQGKNRRFCLLGKQLKA